MPAPCGMGGPGCVSPLSPFSPDPLLSRAGTTTPYTNTTFGCRKLHAYAA